MATDLEGEKLRSSCHFDNINPIYLIQAVGSLTVLVTLHLQNKIPKQ